MIIVKNIIYDSGLDPYSLKKGNIAFFHPHEGGNKQKGIDSSLDKSSDALSKSKLMMKFMNEDDRFSPLLQATNEDFWKSYFNSASELRAARKDLNQEIKLLNRGESIDDSQYSPNIEDASNLEYLRKTSFTEPLEDEHIFNTNYEALFRTTNNPYQKVSNQDMKDILKALGDTTDDDLSTDPKDRTADNKRDVVKKFKQYVEAGDYLPPDLNANIRLALLRHGL